MDIFRENVIDLLNQTLAFGKIRYKKIVKGIFVIMKLSNLKVGMSLLFGNVN